MTFWDDISERLAGLTGASTPVEARDALNEFNVRDVEAVRVSEGGGGGGAGSNARLLGPYPVTFDSSGLLADPGFELFPLNAGDWLIDAWVEINEQFDVADSLFLLGVDGDNISYFTGFGWDLSVGVEHPGPLSYIGHTAASPSAKLTAGRSGDGDNRDVPAHATVGCTVNAVIYPSGSNPAVGNVNVWALVATPAI